MTSPFGRPALLTASFHKSFSLSLSGFINLFIGEELPHYFSKENQGPVNCVEDLHSRLDSLNREEIFDTVCVVDLTNSYVSNWNITCPEKGLRPSELVLLYPEVYWIFLVVKGPLGMHANIQKNHFVVLSEMQNLVNLLKRHADGFRSWFDPYGFRNVIRTTKTPLNYGAAIDDENDFAILNGYLLYKNNYAAFVISSFSEMEIVLNGKGEIGSQNEDDIKLSVVMEDVELNFCDIKEHIKKEDKFSLFTSNIKGRKRNVYDVLYKHRPDKFEALKKISRRVFVSSVSDFKGRRPCDCFVSKPFGGMYDRKLQILRDNIIPDKDGQNKERLVPEGHSVGDARAQLVAESLIGRARTIAKDAKTTESAIHAALLASDAWRLLKGECLALSLETLDIQQRMEATAECTFVGTSNKLDVKERIKVLSKEVKGLVGSKRNGRYQEYNAMVEIADGLRQVYRDFDQFIEEDEAIKIVRLYEWKLKYRTFQSGATLYNILLFPKFLFFGAPSLYFIHVISALWKMGLWVVLWLLLFAGLYNWLSLDECCGFLDTGTSVCIIPFGKQLIYSAESFFAPGATELKGCSAILHIVHIVEMVFGVTHIGIFVSFLFQKISRR